jgi:hypothetical protein
MRRGHTQGFAVFASAASKLLVNRGVGEVVNIASIKMMKKLFAGSVFFRHCEERSDEAIQGFMCSSGSLPPSLCELRRTGRLPTLRMM